MPKQVTLVVSNLDAPISTGEVTLVAGTVVEAGIAGHDPSPAVLRSVVMLSRRVIGGTPGDLSYIWDPVTGTLTVNSSSGTDTSVVEYVVIGK